MLNINIFLCNQQDEMHNFSEFCAYVCINMFYLKRTKRKKRILIIDLFKFEYYHIINSLEIIWLLIND